MFLQLTEAKIFDPIRKCGILEQAINKNKNKTNSNNNNNKEQVVLTDVQSQQRKHKFKLKFEKDYLASHWLDDYGDTTQGFQWQAENKHSRQNESNIPGESCLDRKATVLMLLPEI